MKASELIEQLTTQLKEYGDLEIRIETRKGAIREIDTLAPFFYKNQPMHLAVQSGPKCALDELTQ